MNTSTPSNSYTSTRDETRDDACHEDESMNELGALLGRASEHDNEERPRFMRSFSFEGSSIHSDDSRVDINTHAGSGIAPMSTVIGSTGTVTLTDDKRPHLNDPMSAGALLNTPEKSHLPEMSDSINTTVKVKRVRPTRDLVTEFESLDVQRPRKTKKRRNLFENGE
jgi:hypothetical protein